MNEEFMAYEGWELRPGDIVYCPRGIGKARILELNARPDPREPGEDGLCKVELLEDVENPVRYFPVHELEKA
jgi:hypothetical protein